MQEELDNIKTSLQSLQLLYDELQEQTDFLELIRSFEIGNNLTSYYDTVRYIYGLAGNKHINTTPEALDFAEKLILHDLGQPQFPAVEHDFQSKIGVESHILAKTYFENALSICDVDEGDSASTKIKKILDFINTHLVYQMEQDDLYRSPVETLSIGSGDCDDYSILASALLESVLIDAALGYYENSQDERHMMVLVRLDSIDYAYWSWNDLTSYGLQPGRWLDIEPQSLITEQGDEEWFEQWDLKYAREIFP